MSERIITTHKVNGCNVCNDAINIRVTDQPGAGGANHRYKIDGPLDIYPGVGSVPKFQVDIRFQDGPILESGVNGITNEALLAVVIDRLQGFQSGKFACEENAEALVKLKECLIALKRRTRQRVARGVEGTLTV